MKIADIDDLKHSLIKYKILDEIPIHVAATIEQYIDCAPAIDPEELPIVKELRAKLARYENIENNSACHCKDNKKVPF